MIVHPGSHSNPEHDTVLGVLHAVRGGYVLLRGDLNLRNNHAETRSANCPRPIYLMNRQPVLLGYDDALC